MAKQAVSRGIRRESLEEGEEAEHDTGDSLDIKPPQPGGGGRGSVDRKRKKADRHHHRDREDQQYHHHGPPGHHRLDRSSANRHNSHKGDRRADRVIKDDRRDYQAHPHHPHHRADPRGYEMEDMRRTQYDNSRDAHYAATRQAKPIFSKRPQSPPLTAPKSHRGTPLDHEEDEQGDRLLEDLRSRLLSKRSQMEVGGELNVDRKSRRGENSNEIESRGVGGKREHKHKSSSTSKGQIVETIDSPEAHYYPEEKHSRGQQHRRRSPAATVEQRDDRELMARRAKLLEAEREMVQRKDLAKRELEERRDRRRGGREDVRSPSPDDDDGEIERKRSRKMEKESKRSKEKIVVPVEDADVVSLSDQTESTDGELEDNSEDSASGSGSGSASGSEEEDSKSEDASASSGTEESKSDVEVHCSPLSIGDLAKSDNSRHESRHLVSHSRSRSRSRSVDSRSHSRSVSPERRHRGRYSDEEEDHVEELSSSDEEGDTRRRRKSASDDDGGREGVSDNDVEMVEETVPVVDEAEQKRLREQEEQRARIAALPNYYPALQVSEGFNFNRTVLVKDSSV